MQDQSSLRHARQVVAERKEEYVQSNNEYEFRREEYRVALAEGVDAETRRRSYSEARAQMIEAREQLHLAEKARDSLQVAAGQKEQEFLQAQEEAQHDYQESKPRYDQTIFVLRLLYVTAALAAGFLIWRYLSHNRAII